MAERGWLAGWAGRPRRLSELCSPAVPCRAAPAREGAEKARTEEEEAVHAPSGLARSAAAARARRRGGGRGGGSGRRSRGAIEGGGCGGWKKGKRGYERGKKMKGGVCGFGIVWTQNISFSSFFFISFYVAVVFCLLTVFSSVLFGPIFDGFGLLQDSCSDYNLLPPY